MKTRIISEYNTESDHYLRKHSKQQYQFTILPNSKYQSKKHSFSQYQNDQPNKLIEEIDTLKQAFNDIATENIKMKTKNTVLEKEIQKYEKAIEDIQHYGLNSNNRLFWKLGNDVNFIFSMKVQIKELKHALDQREEAINKIKKMTRYTKLLELEMEKSIYQHEFIRLSNYFEQLSQQQQKYHVAVQQQQQLSNQTIELNSLIMRFENDNVALSQAIKELDKENRQLKNASKQKMPSEENKSNQEVQSLTQQLQFKEREINQLKLQISNQDSSKKANSNVKSQIAKQSGQHFEDANALQQLQQFREDYVVKQRENQELKKQLSEIMEYLKSKGLIDDNMSGNQSRVSEGSRKQQSAEDFSQRLIQQQKVSDNYIDEQVEDDDYDENPFQKEIEEMRMKKKMQQERKVMDQKNRPDESLENDVNEQFVNQYAYDEFERDEEGSYYKDNTPNSA